MDKLGDLIPGSLKKAGAARSVRAAVIARSIEAAAAAAVPEAEGKVRMTTFKDGTARVRCENSVIAEEVRLRAAEIAASANEQLGGDHVRRIVATS